MVVLELSHEMRFLAQQKNQQWEKHNSFPLEFQQTDGTIIAKTNKHVV
jgi:hypothetical protein